MGFSKCRVYVFGVCIRFFWQHGRRVFLVLVALVVFEVVRSISEIGIFVDIVADIWCSLCNLLDDFFYTLHMSSRDFILFGYNLYHVTFKGFSYNNLFCILISLASHTLVNIFSDEWSFDF